MAPPAAAPFLETIKSRRSIYAISKSAPVPDARVQEIIREVLLHVPSSFNSQSTRIVLLVGAEHDKFWEFVKQAIKAIVPAEQWAGSEKRLDGFKGGYGSILFFEARSAVQTMQQKFATYAERFPGWATQSDGMHQFAIWTALEAEGAGASLQHYNPLVDQKVQSEWGIDPDWELNAQLVYGKKEAEAGEKTFLPVEDRFKVFGV